MSPRTLGPALAAVTAALLAGPLAADVLKVPKQYATIQSALDAAGSGDVVEVAKGTYVESIVFSFKTNVTLRAKDDAIVTVDAAGAHHALLVSSVAYARIERIRFRNASEAVIRLVGNGKGIVLVKCRATGGARGIDVDSTPAFTVRKCVVRDVTESAIHLGSSSIGGFVTKNDLADFSSGIVATGVLHTIEENTLTSPGLYGISLISCERTCAVANEIEGISADGLRMIDTIDCTFAGNLVVGGQTGLRIESNAIGAVVEKNKVVDAIHGYISFADGARFMANKAQKCSSLGFALSGERLLVHRNLALKTLFYGFDITATQSSYVGNVAELSGTVGRYVTTTAFETSYWIGNDFDGTEYH